MCCGANRRGRCCARPTARLMSGMDPRPISRRAVLGGSLKAPEVAPAPSFDGRCMATGGVYCRSCADACAEGAMCAAPALGGTVRIAVDRIAEAPERALHITLLHLKV